MTQHCTKQIALFITAFVSFYANGQTKDIETTAEIKHLIIYNSSAEINYQKEMLLPEGKTTVTFTDLSPFIVKNTINVSVSDPSVDIITITDKINYIKERTDQNKKANYLQDSVDHIANELGLLKCKTEAMRMEKEILFKDESIGGVSKGVSVAEIEKASVFYSKRYTELSTAIFKLHEKEKQLASDLKKYQSQAEEVSSNTSKAGSEIQVTVINPSQKKVLFSFKFLTDKAGWAPVYDFKYQGAENPLKFIFRATVFNATGVPWENAAITLSTAAPTADFDAPALASTNTSTSEINTRMKGSIKFRELEVTNAIAEYPIKHKHSILSDSRPYLIDVDAYTMNAAYNYLLIPKLDPFGFLMAKIPDWNKYNLIPGVTNIYNKGSFMGKTFLNTYAENDTLTIYLGKDNNIQATRKEITLLNKHNIMANCNEDRTTLNFSIKNNTDEKLLVQMLDQVPMLAYNERIKFSVPDSELADYNKQECTLIWNFSLQQHESKTFDYRYEIRSPRSNGNHQDNVKRKFRAISCPTF
jgi:hypothetical protein